MKTCYEAEDRAKALIAGTEYVQRPIVMGELCNMGFAEAAIMSE
jgi:hypothetical protein